MRSFSRRPIIIPHTSRFVNTFFKTFLKNFLLLFLAQYLGVKPFFDHISRAKNKGAKCPLIYNVYIIFNYPSITIPVITSAITA